MTGEYKIFGSEMSPYSIKVRTYFRYKRIPHQWIPRTAETEAEYKKFARLPIVPTVATPDGLGLQDSTPIIEQLDRNYAEPSIHPPGELGFLSALIEEFGDEWGNKLMFHHRWYDEVDARVSARTLARLSLPFGSMNEVEERAKAVLARMSGRGHFVGSSDATAPLITGYYLELLDILEPHLAIHKYLFGARPAFGDFGLAAQLYEASVDPTGGGIIRARGRKVLDWCFRMVEPRNDGPFESWDLLGATLEPLIAYIGRYFLPWSVANAEALENGAESFSVDLAGRNYTQSPQKYHAKSLAVLRQKFKALDDRSALDPILKKADCLRYLV